MKSKILLGVCELFHIQSSNQIFFLKPIRLSFVKSTYLMGGLSVESDIW